MPVVPILGRLRQKVCEFEVSLGCEMRPCLKTKQNKNGRGGEERTF
jgi:hypothetical protein